MFKVCFEYDEPTGKWEVMVDGASSPTEAIQGFNAVLLTAREAEVHMQHKAEPIGERFKINVGM